MKSALSSLLLLLVPSLLFAPTASAQPEQPRFTLELEAGGVWQSRNDVRVPNDTGTRFAADELIGNDATFAGRVNLTWNVRDKHSLQAVLAPLEITGTGTPEENIDFEGARFAAATATDATYQFNSWRLGYRYRFFHGERWTLRTGFTAKIRDARIELAQPGISAKKTDTGFVPLAHFSGVYRFSEKWRFLFELDALGGGPGRAEDLNLEIGYQVTPDFLLSAGYRTVEGGADVDEVFNFAWLNYGVVSATFSF